MLLRQLGQLKDGGSYINKMSKFLAERLEKNSVRWLGVFLLAMFVLYLLSSLGKVAWLNYVSMIFGFFLSGLLLIESGIITYIRKKEYKTIGLGDAIVFLSVIASVGLLMNSLLMLNFVRLASPLWLVNFSVGVAVVVSVIGAILSIIHFFSPRFK
jgi:hypothetical protein